MISLLTPTKRVLKFAPPNGDEFSTVRLMLSDCDRHKIYDILQWLFFAYFFRAATSIVPSEQSRW